jgi:hypothetical protein
MASDSSSLTANHRWKFFRAGGFDQVRFETGADLIHLAELDQKLWAALSCPTRGVEFDPTTLDLIDTDKDGRVRAPEILVAVKWACSVVKDPEVFLRSSNTLELSAINEAVPEGKQLLSSAREILANLGKSDMASISIEDTADPTKIFAATRFNGDGIIHVDTAGDETTKAALNDIMACYGSETDRSGKLGVSQAKTDQFFADAQAYSDWWTQAEVDAARILPFGNRTAEAYAAFKALRTKLDDYFARCRLAAFDRRALAAVNRQESEYLAFAAMDLTITAAEIAGFPIARIEPNRPLALKEPINPAWTGAMAAFESSVIRPMLGERAELTEADWAVVCGKLAAYEAWVESQAGATVEQLGLKRIRELLASPAKQTLTDLIAQDKAREADAASIASVDKLLRFRRDLKQLLVNFVSFEDFYSRKRKAIFQNGTLYLDGRSCELCVHVADTAKHATLAGLAKSYLAYCDCSRSTGEKMTIAAAFTDGDADYLMVGRNGLFYDRKGRDWDATITKVIENPISIRQAFWAPYKKLVRLVEEQVAKRAAAAQTTADSAVSCIATPAAGADKAKPEQKKVDVGTVAALGVAFGAIGTALAAFAGYLAGVLKLPFWQVCLAFLGLLLLVSGPSMLIALLKLRQRNLGPILDANGWAVNGRVKMNVPFGGSLTAVAELPPGAQPSFAVPYPEPPTALPKSILAIIAICFLYSLLNHFGLVYRISGGAIGKQPPQPQQPPVTATTTVTVTAPGAPAPPLGTNAPAK